MKTLSVDVDVDLDEFDTEDLIDELESRGYTVTDEEEVQSSETIDVIEELYQQFTTNQTVRPETLRELFHQNLGRIA